MKEEDYFSIRIIKSFEWNAKKRERRDTERRLRQLRGRSRFCLCNLFFALLFINGSEIHTFACCVLINTSLAEFLARVVYWLARAHNLRNFQTSTHSF